jgi:hypothetical protein
LQRSEFFIVLCKCCFVCTHFHTRRLARVWAVLVTVWVRVDSGRVHMVC